MPLKALARRNRYFFLLYEGQKYEIPAHKKIVFIDLPPNKYFEIEAINLDNTSVHSKRSYSFRMPCIPTKPLHFELNETNTCIYNLSKREPHG